MMNGINGWGIVPDLGEEKTDEITTCYANDMLIREREHEVEDGWMNWTNEDDERINTYNTTNSEE